MSTLLHAPFHLPTRRSVLQMSAALGVALVAPAKLARATPRPPLAKDHVALISDVADLIIPQTDTGGARAAGVPRFAVHMLNHWFDDAEYDNFVRGLRSFDAEATHRYGKRYLRLSQEQKYAYFGDRLRQAEMAGSSPTSSASPPPRAPGDTLMSEAAGARAAALPPRSSFVVLMKRLTVFGYYTSELGGSVELVLDVMPGRYDGDAVIEQGQRDESSIMVKASPFRTY